jgi:hypothetical protein
MLEGALHEHHLLRFEVIELDQPFKDCERTAEIHFFDENNKKAFVFNYGIVTPEEIFAKIDRNESINLNNAYIKNFSLSAYRETRGLDAHSRVHLKSFSAKRTFFDCDISTDFSYAEFGGSKIVFKSAVFSNGNANFFNAIFSHGDVSFEKAKFGSGNVNFKSVKFGDGSITFNGANFGIGNLSFVDADFNNGHVDFMNTFFGDGNIDFKFARFATGDISFEKSSFGKGKKDFKNVEFGGGKIDFRRIQFNSGDVSFEGVEFGDGKVSFRSSLFGHGHKSFELADFAHGEAQFDLVDFGSGTISFNRAKASHVSFSGCHLNCYADFRFEECRMMDLSNTIVRDILDIKAESERVAIQEMSLVGMRILGKIFIDWRVNKVQELIYNQKRTSYFQKSEQFRILKENFRNNGQYEDEDDAYVEFRRCNAKADLLEYAESAWRRYFFSYPKYYFQRFVFDYIGKYATAPVRVLLNLLIAIVFYGLLYFGFTEFFPELGSVASTLPIKLNRVYDFWNCMYYSAITFFTVGYGDYFADGLVKLVAVMEGFTGVFLMSYFTVAFVRKILR